MFPLHFWLYPKYIYMTIILSEFIPKKSSILSINLCDPPIYHTNVLWKSCFIRKYLHFLFHLHSNCICMPIISSEFFQQFLILSIILCNPQFYHTQIRWKYAVLSENILTSFFNYILKVFVCLYIWVFSKHFLIKLNIFM